MLGQTNSQLSKININELLQLKYQSDSIYMSTNVTSPASLFGGDWEPINGSFLVAAGTNFVANSINTISKHTHSVDGCTLTTAMMPSHSHSETHYHPVQTGYRYITYNYSVVNTGVGEYTTSRNKTSSYNQPCVDSTSTDFTGTQYVENSSPATDAKGSNGSHNHGNTSETVTLPPYLVVDMWHKINYNLNNISLQSYTPQILLNLLYPIGYIYISFNNISPASLFGGTWVQLKDRFLLASSTEYILGTTGGSSTHTHSTSNHTLTLAETPSHNHTVNSHSHTPSTTGNHFLIFNYSTVQKGVAETYIPNAGGTNIGCCVNSTAVDFQGWGTTGGASATTDYQGGNGAHNHGDTGEGNSMPPYTTVYMWTRTA